MRKSETQNKEKQVGNVIITLLAAVGANNWLLDWGKRKIGYYFQQLALIVHDYTTQENNH